MMGQASRFLVKLVAKAAKGNKLAYPFTYLTKMQETLGLKNQARTVDDFLNADILDKALQARACHLIAGTMRDYQASSASKKVKDNELFYQAKNIMTKAHLLYLQFHLFRTECQKKNFADRRTSEVMELAGKVWALEQLLEDGAAVYDSGFFAPGTYRAMQSALERCISDIRP